MATNLNNFENVLQTIHSKYISLPEHEVRRNNEILYKVLDQVIKEMKNDALFAKLYNRIFYGGSYFDGLRVGKPEEFDLDILLKVPKIAKPSLSHTNQPGYMWLQFGAPQELSDDFKRKFVDDKNYLSTKKMKEWMIGLVTKATNKFRTNGNLTFNVVTGSGSYHLQNPGQPKFRTNCNLTFDVVTGSGSYHLQGRITNSGPAVTLHLKCVEFSIDVDLVPCIEFTADSWPTGGYKANPVANRSTFFIVPKSPQNQNPAERYWRLSFQEQERELINGKERLKPTLKLLKRLRDVQNHKAIASYYIKTVFLWENEKNGAAYWRETNTEVFFKMLDNYIKYIEEGKIPYFWNKKNNLLNITQIQRDNIKYRLRAIQKDLLAKYKTDPKVIFQYLDIEL